MWQSDCDPRALPFGLNNKTIMTNKHAQIRYTVLDKCFSNFYRLFTKEDLLEYCKMDTSAMVKIYEKQKMLKLN